MKLYTFLTLFIALYSTAILGQCSVSITSSTNLYCNGVSTGTATAVGSGGISPYNYLWSMGQNTATATGLPAGNYCVTVTDFVGCTATTCVNITQPPALSVIISSTTHVYCFGGSNGSLTASTSGGTGSVTYIWGANTGSQATATATGLSAGNYCVTVTDANGCTASTCANIFQPTLVSASINSSSNVSCFGGSDGNASVLAMGGTPAYLFSWSNGNSTSTISNVPAGTYCVTVTDMNMCTASTCVTITQPPLFVIDAVVTSNYNGAQITCNGASNGSVSTNTVSGGTFPAVYAWGANTGNATTNTVTGLPAGTYCVTVTDANNCVATDCVTMTQPPALSISLSGPDTICAGTTTTITATPMGGISAYSYMWYNGSTVSSLPNAGAGNHCVTVTDINGCSVSSCKLISLYNFEVSFNPNNTLYNSLNQAFGITTPGQAYSIQTQTTAPGMTVYSWSPSTGLSSTAIPNPLALPAVSTAYYLQSINASTGCMDLDTIIVYLHETNISRIEISPDSTASHCTDIPMMMSGGTSSAAASSTSNYGTVSSPSFGCFEYTSNGTAPEVVDTIVWINCDQYYSPIAFTYIPICDTNIVYITTASCVWPGDTDDDGIANNMDLLPIGLHHGATGLVRQNANNSYTCQPARNWNIGTSGNPTVDIKHIDSDGNGTINDLDTNAIVLNWSQTHIKSISTTTTGIELYIDTATTSPGDTVTLPIILGDAQNPTAGYGVAFTINYDVDGVDTNSVSIDYNNSWLGTIGNNMIGISKDFYTAGQVQVAMTRTNHSSVMGGGTIGHIRFTIKDDVLPKSAFVRLDFEITNIRFIDNLGDTIATIGVPSQILVVDGPVGNSTIENSKNEISVFPNPTGNLLNVQSLNEEIEMIQIMDMTGKLLLEQTNIQNLQTSLNMNALPSGMYILNIQTSSKMQQVRVLKN